MHAMATLLMFAAARDAAGTGRVEIDAATVGEVLARAEADFGDGFRAVLQSCRVWVNGEPADPQTAVRSGDEVAILPPVSGGSE